MAESIVGCLGMQAGYPAQDLGGVRGHTKPHAGDDKTQVMKGKGFKSFGMRGSQDMTGEGYFSQEQL